MQRITVTYGQPTSVEEFEEHYANTHIDLVKALPGLARFTTSHPTSLNGGESPYFVAELWFADEAALKAALTSPQMAAAGEDAATLPATMTMYIGEVDEQ